MKSTGIIRRFDDLGRIVIPKELRKRINNGNPEMCGIAMEVYEDGDTIVLRKYKTVDEECTDCKVVKSCYGLNMNSKECPKRKH